jgi:hypothetical protein
VDQFYLKNAFNSQRNIEQMICSFFEHLTGKECWNQLLQQGFNAAHLARIFMDTSRKDLRGGIFSGDLR